MKQIGQPYRQGDVLLVPVDALNTTDHTVVKSKTLALGEVTGHHHTFTDQSDIICYERTSDSSLAVNNRGMLVEARSESTLVHQEHAPVIIPRGMYIRVIQREYSPEEIRNVQD